jgi:hypothetical protein
LVHKWTFRDVRVMSALPRKRTFISASRKRPKADMMSINICTRLVRKPYSRRAIALDDLQFRTRPRLRK